jgi:hypothetical protein
LRHDAITCTPGLLDQHSAERDMGRNFGGVHMRNGLVMRSKRAPAHAGKAPFSRK